MQSVATILWLCCLANEYKQTLHQVYNIPIFDKALLSDAKKYSMSSTQVGR